jgi:hypothetical protein
MDPVPLLTPEEIAHFKREGYVIKFGCERTCSSLQLPPTPGLSESVPPETAASGRLLTS